MSQDKVKNCKICNAILTTENRHGRHLKCKRCYNGGGKILHNITVAELSSELSDIQEKRRILYKSLSSTQEGLKRQQKMIDEALSILSK